MGVIALFVLVIIIIATGVIAYGVGSSNKASALDDEILKKVQEYFDENKDKIKEEYLKELDEAGMLTANGKKILNKRKNTK